MTSYTHPTLITRLLIMSNSSGKTLSSNNRAFTMTSKKGIIGSSTTQNTRLYPLNIHKSILEFVLIRILHVLKVHVLQKI